METQQIGMFMTDKDKEKFDSWTKEQIYEAYLLEVEKSNKINKELNVANRLIAEIKFKATR